jgi:phospholipid transport system substrate-binding protein
MINCNFKSLLFFNGLKTLLTVGVFLTSFMVSASSLESVEQSFKTQVAFINQTLKVNQKAFEASPHLLAGFVDNSLLPLWEASQTLAGLLGSKNWHGLSHAEQAGLQKAFNDTIQRYVQEGFALYDGQTLEFVSVKLNDSATRGLLTLKVIPNVMPSFEVDFKIFKQEETWQLYDILVQGVSYITLKKDSYRKQLAEQGVKGILATISEKNQGYIASMREPVIKDKVPTVSRVEQSATSATSNLQP